MAVKGVGESSEEEEPELASSKEKTSTSVKGKGRKDGSKRTGQSTDKKRKAFVQDDEEGFRLTFNTQSLQLKLIKKKKKNLLHSRKPQKNHTKCKPYNSNIESKSSGYPSF